MENSQIMKPAELNFAEFKQELFQVLIRANQERHLSYTLIEPVIADFYRQVQDASRDELTRAQETYVAEVKRLQESEAKKSEANDGVAVLGEVTPVVEEAHITTKEKKAK